MKNILSLLSSYKLLPLGVASVVGLGMERIYHIVASGCEDHQHLVGNRLSQSNNGVCSHIDTYGTHLGYAIVVIPLLHTLLDKIPVSGFIRQWVLRPVEAIVDVVGHYHIVHHGIGSVIPSIVCVGAELLVLMKMESLSHDKSLGKLQLSESDEVERVV